MIAYPDTSFLVAIYRPQINSPKAASYFAAMSEPLHVTALLLFEFRQTLRLQQFLHRQNPLLGFNQTAAERAAADLQSDLDAGVIVIVPADWSGVLQAGEDISAQHTALSGTRGFDILHVATALHLGAREFLTFDANQKKLARTKGLKIPL